MKKRFEIVKVLQLIIYVSITAAAITTIFINKELYQLVGRDPSIRILCILLWICLATGFVGILRDINIHSALKRQYRELDQAVYSDHVAGIANRFSCDAVIEKYIDRQLGNNIGCIMLEIENIREINEKYGHTRGNDTLKAFSNILSTAALGVCFVGRNGGSKFLAIFEECTDEKINTFISNINRLVEENNAEGCLPQIVYCIGQAFSGEEKGIGITSLIALADKRLTGRMDALTGTSNRYACDDMIARYMDSELPESICCVMIELTNIREINRKGGHSAGNLAIRHFSDVLRESAAGFGFIGRNSGTGYMGLFENCDENRLNEYLERLSTLINEKNNAEMTELLEYRYAAAGYGVDRVSNIVELVALADRRIKQLTDKVPGILNRAGCDDLIGKYIGQTLPEDICCIMFDIENIRRINEEMGYAEGNNTIKKFGEMLVKASAGKCFVGRNGGSKYLVIFEKCGEDQLKEYVSGIESMVERYNSISEHASIRFRRGIAFREKGIKEINRLVALADRRLSEPKAGENYEQT